MRRSVVSPFDSMTPRSSKSFSYVLVVLVLALLDCSTFVESAAAAASTAATAAASVNVATSPKQSKHKKSKNQEVHHAAPSTSFLSWTGRLLGNQTAVENMKTNRNVRWLTKRFFPAKQPGSKQTPKEGKTPDVLGQNESVVLGPTNGLLQSRLRAMSSSFLDEDWKRRLQERRDQFIERVAVISSWLLWKQEEELKDTLPTPENANAITNQSNLARMPPRSIHLVTTAALPWYTGTSINPLLRAAYIYQTLTELQRQDQEPVGGEGNLKSVEGEGFANIEASNRNKHVGVSVTLVVPWLERPEDQDHLYHCRFSSPADQEVTIRAWLRDQAGLPDAAEGLQILFYPARYHNGLRSIFAMGDLIKDVILKHNTTKLDVCILEEPEHCNWFRAPGDGWTQQFEYVVGIIHTNYKEYAATSHYSGLWTAPALAMICSAMVRAYCHKVIKLSDALQTFCPGKEVTSNVHGVREEFWKQGLQLAHDLESHATSTKEDGSLLLEPRVYFLGKLLWAKGLDILLELQQYYGQCTGSYFPIDIYGSGPDADDIERAFSRKPAWNNILAWNKIVPASPRIEPSTAIPFITSSSLLLSSLGINMQLWSTPKSSALGQVDTPNMLTWPQMQRRQPQEAVPAQFLGRVDHARLPHNYTVFVNPSLSEVLCTATAEALAMGKFVIVPYHPSNYWFLQFPNCLPYRNKLEFVANLRWALSHDPKPLTEEQAREFSWQAATERLFRAAAMTHNEAAFAMDVSSKLEGERIAWLHNEVLGKGSRGDVIRKVLGAGPVSEQVRYQQETAQKGRATADGGADARSEDEDENEGLGLGFSQSWFATAIRSAWSDITKFAVS